MFDKKLIWIVCCLVAFFSAPASAIYLGNLTFSMPAKSSMVTRYVVNNNKEARVYRVMLRSIDKPGEDEVNMRPKDGEILYSPRQITLQPGEGDFFKFHYHGPEDDKERYYRVYFQEIPAQNRTTHRAENSAVSMMPVIVMQTILVVRPRKINFRWEYDKMGSVIKNTGNTWFKLLLKPHCDATEEESDAWYMRPGDVLRQDSVRQAENIFIIYNEKFIKVTNTCI
ncbi:fimbria/pilus periplasmic chaperone [Vagococcus sp. WN89Y]|uniref:fimbria/pilus periplasmic chaperone n=1 Tax=Vagococcus sp. WN89Y TaxID=3457258 RepID=UPI003FCCB38B